MTRFVGEAIAHRKGKGVETGKDRVKKMQKFLETGSHDDIERAKLLREQGRLPDLPEHDPNRSFVFMDVAIANKPAGRLVIELFDDIIPVGASHLKNRCLAGSRVGLAGCSVQKLVPHYAAFLGRNPQASEGMTLRPVNSLRALEPGTVSISMKGDEVAIALAKALTLDTTGYQVVGRICKGKEVLDLMNDVVPGPDSVPYTKITITKCGTTNARGDHEENDASGPVSKADAVRKLTEESASARSAVLEALEVGLGASGKRKAQEGDHDGAGPSGSQAGQAAKQQKTGGGPDVLGKGGAPGEAGKGTSKSRALDAVLGGLSDDSDDSSDGDGES